MKRHLHLVSFVFILTLVINKTQAQDTLASSQQMQSIMKEKKSRSLAQQKISSQLLQAIRQKKEPNKTGQDSIEPVNVNADEKGNLKVDIKAEITDQLLNNIKTLGGKIVFVSKEYRSIRAEINLLVVEKIAAYPAVKFIEPAAMPMNNRVPAKLIP